MRPLSKTIPHPIRTFIRHLILGAAIASSLSLSGCVSPIAINRAMVAYDQSVMKAEKELLLINLLRMRDEESPHFTITSSIAATFDFRVSGTLSGEVFHNDLLGLHLGSEVAENPTATMIPVQGEEFTRRVLLPLDHSRFEFLSHQPHHLAALLRLAVREVEPINHKTGHRLIVNSPGYREEYIEFRRLVLHLTYLHSIHRLYIAPLVYEEEQDLPENFSLNATNLEGILERGGRFERNNDGSGYVLKRIVYGRTIITNYPLASLSNQERRDLDLQTKLLKTNEIPIDIKAGHPGGNFTFRAILRLRSLYETLRFAAKGLGPEAEFDVDPDPTTGIITQQHAAAEINPASTFQLESGEALPVDTFVSTQFKGQYYWLPNIKDTPNLSESWNRDVFAMLHTMYQLSVSEATTKASSPEIAITK